MATSLLDRPVSFQSPAADLVIERTDIQFYNIAPLSVEIRVRVFNVGEICSCPTAMRLQAAPLGAFLPWQDLTSLMVPPIDSGDSIELATEAFAPSTKPLGEFSRVPPRRLLTAIGNDDDSQDRPKPEPTSGWGQFFARLVGTSESRDVQTLPDDPLRLLARPNIHWAGNINVLIGRHAVERHLAQALRIYPGRTNLAVFFVGDRRDEYQFELTGSGSKWDAMLFDCTGLSTITAARSSATPILRSKWIRMEGCRMLLLAICPPVSCKSGAIEVHIRQRSTDRDALVEFSLDANAAGAGCYAV